MPAVAAPAPGGVTFHQARKLIHGLVRKGRVVGMDVVEITPSTDVNRISSITAGRLFVNLMGAAVRANYFETGQRQPNTLRVRAGSIRRMLACSESSLESCRPPPTRRTTSSTSFSGVRTVTSSMCSGMRPLTRFPPTCGHEERKHHPPWARSRRWLRIAGSMRSIATRMVTSTRSSGTCRAGRCNMSCGRELRRRPSQPVIRYRWRRRVNCTCSTEGSMAQWSTSSRTPKLTESLARTTGRASPTPHRWRETRPYSATPNQQHVFYRGDDDHIHHIVWSAGPGPPGADDWTAKANAPLATGDPVAMLVGNQQHVFYRSIGGSIAHIVWAPSSGAPVADDWTAKAVAPRAAGERVAPLLASGQQHVFYRAVGGGVVHILWNPATNAMGWDDWTLRSGAPLAAGDPTALATDGQQHVFYRSVAGSVIHVLWHAGLDHPRCDDWTFQSGSAAIAGNVGAFRSSEGPDPLALRILALGDSMTEGFVPQWKGGYRARLFQTAHRAGKHLAFVGSRFDGPLTIDGVCFPRAHEGHSGKNIDFIATLIPEVLSSKPKIILLMVGANDVLRRGDANYDAAALGDAPNRLGRLLDSLVAAEPDALVVVAKIPLTDPRNPLHPEEPVNPLVSAAAWDASIRTYNEGVESVVRQRMVAGARIALADMHTGFTPAMLGEDGTHPNEDGYQHIASVWYEAIRGYLN